MVGYLIYHKDEAVKNQKFIACFQEEGKLAGIDFCYVPVEQYTTYPLPDFVLNRTRDSSVSKWYEMKKIPVFHSSFLTEIGNHKMKTYEYLKERLPKEILKEKWAPKSYFLPSDVMAEWLRFLENGQHKILPGIQKYFGDIKEFVIKSVDGHGGTEVALLNDNNLEKVVRQFQRKDCILQEKIQSDSKDIRIYLLGNQIYQAVCRQGKKDFRSNFSLGGVAYPCTLSDSQRAWIESFLQAFSEEIIGLAGMDFIIDTRGRLIFNELEEMVGCRMLYQYTDKNVVKDYVAWLQKFVKNNSCHK